ncbi:hypothetical protein GGR58DRAFT_529326 [Xylaria digitata]|nr:hypothetical protein GGR58DRAFT_529326 [Xylaria digitata]
MAFMSGYPGLEITEEQYERNRPPGLEVSPHQQQNWQSDTQRGHDQESSVTKSTPFSSYKIDQSIPRERTQTFTIAIAIILTAIIIGATLGGGLGTSLSKCQSNLRMTPVIPNHPSVTAGPSSTTTSPEFTTTSLVLFPATTGGLLVNYTVAPSTEIWDLAVDCTDLSSTFQESQYRDMFSVHCYTEWGNGNRKDIAKNDVIIGDVMSLIAYSMVDCLQACSVYTSTSQTAGIASSCESAVWINDMAHYQHYHGNCFLKNSTVAVGSGNSPCGWCFSANKIP